MPNDRLDSAIALVGSSSTSHTGTWDCGPGTRSPAPCSASCRRDQRRTANPGFLPESFSGSRPPERGDARCRSNVPYSAIDIPEVMSRNRAAHDIVSGFASATPTLSVAWQHIDAALADTRDLATEVTRLSAELAAARLWHANALAAMRATIGAQRDGEPDPLYYIRDELSALRTPPGAPRGRR